MSSNKTRKRDVSLDIIRCIAFFLVATVHAFLNGGFYSQPVSGKAMYLLTAICSNAMICVPIFFLLSGYLMCKKKLEKKYYFGIVKTLGIYVLAGILCILFRIFVNASAFTPDEIVLQFLGFSAAPYAWYIEMYVGLFLLIPFLNLAYNGLETKKHKKILILTMIFITALPPIFNTLDVFNPGFWASPPSSLNFRQLLPDWWVGIYPIAYYFVGCYLREFGIKIRLRYRIPLYILSFVAVGAYNCYRFNGVVFASLSFNYYQSLFVMIPAVLLFSIIKDINFTKLPSPICRFIATCSDLTLGAYLISYVFDDYFYKKLTAAFPVFRERVLYFPLVILAVFVCSLGASFVLNVIYSLIFKLCSACKRLITRKHATEIE